MASVKAKAIKWFIKKAEWCRNKRDIECASTDDKKYFNLAINSYIAGHRAGVRASKASNENKVKFGENYWHKGD